MLTHEKIRSAAIKIDVKILHMWRAMRDVLSTGF